MMMRRVFAVLFGVLVSPSCAVEPGNDGPQTMCTPGLAYACNCVNGAPGAATCGLDGTPGVCMCTSSTDGATTIETTSSPATTEPDSATCGTGCGDTTDTPESTGPDACAVYSGKVDSVSVPWSFSGQTGLAAGAAMCTSIGADHLCEYLEVVDAEQRGELDGLSGFTTWIHRTTIEEVDQVPSAPGPGGRCVDWTDGSGTLADGEWAEFAADGVVYHLDDDTFYDGLDGSHTDPLSFPCMGVARAMLCCNAPC